MAVKDLIFSGVCEWKVHLMKSIDSNHRSPFAPYILITSSLACILISIWCLQTGFTIIFQNLFYIPIIIACVLYTRRGFLLSCLLAFIYFGLMAGFTQDSAILLQAFIRVILFIGIAGVVTLLASSCKKSEDMFRHLSEFQESIIANARVWIMVLDQKGNIRLWNTAAEEISGYLSGEVIGKNNIWKLLYPDQEYHSQVTNTIHRIISTRNYFENFETVIHTKKGEMKVISWNTKGIVDQNQRINEYIAIGVDVTDKHQAEESLVQANKKLNLLSNITRHDIGNELQIIFGYIGLSKEHESDSRIKEYLDNAQLSAQNIERQIAFTRDYQNIGVHSPAWQDVGTLISGIARPIDFGLIKLHVTISGIEIFADPLLVKVFYNLIDNAKRYGETITEIQFSGHEGTDGYTIVCEDNGVGIPYDFKSKIFNREFYKHTGFGLNLSREILEITGISIKETGEPGKGARFEILVPEGKFRLLSEEGR